MSELPSGWVLSTFGELNRFESRTLDPSKQPQAKFELYSVPSFPGGEPERVEGAQIGSTKQTVEPDDVLVCKINPRINRVWRVAPKRDRSQIASSEWIGFRSEALHPVFAKHYFSSPEFRELLCSEVAGVGGSLTRAQPKRVAGYPVPVAPLSEQSRIADQLDTLLARADACKQRLDFLPELLARFRRAALDAAMTGVLTREARDPNHTRLTVDDLLAARLQVEEPTRKKSVHVFFAAHPPEAQAPDLPEGWLKAHVGVVARVSNGSTPSRSVASYWGGEIPWVSSGEVANNRIVDTKEKISEAGFRESSVRLLPKGSVLLAMIGEGKTRGQSALLDVPACINQNIAGVIPVPELITPKYLWYWFQQQYETTRTKGNGSGPKALNCERVRELVVHLPPVEEQIQIVQHLEMLFGIADRLQASHSSATSHAQRLVQLTLSKAFRGDLVEQDPQDEPASELLARLAESRDAQPRPARGRKRGAGAQPSTSQPNDVPDWLALPDGAWACPPDPEGLRASVLLTAVLRAWGDSEAPQAQARLAYLLCEQPRLLSAVLPEALAQQWQRLVGDEAQPVSAEVSVLQPAVNIAWRRAVIGMRARGDLLEVGAGADAKWALSAGADAIETKGWPQGRAGFVVGYLRAHGIESVLPTLEPAQREFVDARAA